VVSQPVQGWELFMSMDAGAHINRDTTIEHRIYAGEDRVTVAFVGTNSARITLFLPHPELLRLRDALTRVITEFDSARATLADHGVTDSAA
jgi:hypothetical protein